MQNVNLSQHQTAKNSWTSGVVYDLLCRVRMYYVPACRDEWGALRPTPTPPGAMMPPGARNPTTIYCERPKKCGGCFLCTAAYMPTM